MCLHSKYAANNMAGFRKGEIILQYEALGQAREEHQRSMKQHHTRNIRWNFNMLRAVGGSSRPSFRMLRLLQSNTDMI
jgi:hypothetical protein